MVSAPGDVGPGQRLPFSDTGGMGSVQIWPKPREYEDQTHIQGSA